MQSNAVGGAMLNIRLHTHFTRTNKSTSLKIFNNQLFLEKKGLKRKPKHEVYNVKQLAQHQPSCLRGCKTKYSDLLDAVLPITIFICLITVLFYENPIQTTKPLLCLNAHGKFNLYNLKS